MGRPTAEVVAKRVRVRCLGPRKKEHFFCSPDAARVRVCKGCRALQVRDNFGARHFPVRVST